MASERVFDSIRQVSWMVDRMNTQPANSTDSQAWRWIEDQLMEFDRRLNRRESPDISEFIRGLKLESNPILQAESLRNQLLAELIKIELEYRWCGRQGETAERYFERYRELDETQREEIIEAELEARCIAGMPPKERELKSRFPNSYQAWAQLVELNESKRVRGMPMSRPQVETLVANDTVGGASHASDDRPTPVTAGDLLGRYELIRELGRGSFAVVWLAKDRQLNRQVAIKLIEEDRQRTDRTLLPRLMREARIVALIEHPGVVQIYEVGEADGQTFIVEQYIQGADLATQLRDGYQSDEQEAVRVVRDMALAAHAAHECGIIHRDIKPANILMDGENTPFLVDFGLAQLENPNEATLTQQGDMLGTPAYMSPQQALGEHHLVDGRADVYSLGAVLFHLVAGRIPFGGSALSVLDSVIHQPASSLFKAGTSVPRDLRTIIVRCMEKEPSSRYASAKLLAEDLSRYLDGEPILARPVGWLERSGKWMRRKPKTALAMACAVLLMAVLVGSLIQLRSVIHQKNRADRLKLQAELELVEKAIVGGQLAKQRGRMTEAVDLLGSALEKTDQAEPDVQLDLVECLIAVRRTKEATDVLRTVERDQMDPELTGRYQLLQGQLELEQKGRGEQAEARFRESLQYPLARNFDHYAQAMLADTTRESMAELEKAVVADPMHHQSHRMLAVLQFSLAEFEALESHLDQLLLLFPADQDFQLLRAISKACLGEEKQANALLDQVKLDSRERKAWEEVCQRLKFICTEYSHYEGESIDFTLKAMSEIAKDYMQVIHPELVRRGFHFPPRIAKRFERIVVELQAFLDGERQEGDLVDPIQDLLAVHPDASLYCWLGGMFINQGELGRAKDSFRKASQSSGFISETNTLKWQGLFTCSAALWQRKVDVDEQLKDGANALAEIEKDQASVDKYAQTSSYSRAVVYFLVDAMKADVVEPKTVRRWLQRTRENETISEPNQHWILAIVANRDQRYFEALKQLDAVEQVDPEFKTIRKEDIKALRDGILDRTKSVRDSIETDQPATPDGSEDKSGDDQ